MKTLKILTTLLGISALPCAYAQTWTEISGILPETNTAKWVSSYKGYRTNQDLIQDLQSTPKDGNWYSYLSTGGKNSPNLTFENGTIDYTKLLSLSGYDTSGWSPTSVWMQHYTLFNIPPQALASNGVKISFNVDFLGTNKTVSGIDIGVLPWKVHDVIIDLRAAPRQQTSTKYLFGLINLATGDFIDCNLSTGETMTFDYAVNDWKYTADDNGTLNASFYIDATTLATATDGFALVIETTWGGAKSAAAEYYAIGDFKTEILANIPEPSTFVLLSGILILLAAVVSRKQ